MFLRRPEEVVEERDVQLEDFDELDHPAVGDVELAVEVEGPRVGLRAVLGDLAVVDVAGELGGVLVLFVLGLEGADADAVLLREEDPLDDDLLQDLGPVAVGLFQPLLEVVAGERADVADDFDLVFAVGSAFVEVAQTSARLATGTSCSGSPCMGSQEIVPSSSFQPKV